MTIPSEISKLKYAKHLIRKAIQRKETGLTTNEIFSVYPDYIDIISEKAPDNTGLTNYTWDYETTFTVNVNTIRDFAFYRWTNLHWLKIEYDEDIVELQGNHAFEGTNISLITVPDQYVNDYKTSPYWSRYSNIIQNSSATWTGKSTNLIQHEELVRTVDWLNSITVADLDTDYR